MKRLLLGVASMCIGSTAQAIHWVDMPPNAQNNGSVEKIDVDSIQRSGSTVSFWGAVVFANLQSDNGVVYNEWRMRHHVDCVNHTDSLTSLSERLDGKVVNQQERYDMDDEPGSVGEAKEQFVCKK